MMYHCCGSGGEENKTDVVGMFVHALGFDEFVLVGGNAEIKWPGRHVLFREQFTT